MQDTLTTLSQKINHKLENSVVFYLSNDPERTLGLEGLIRNYHLVYMDQSQYSQYFTASGIKHFCLFEENNSEIFRSSVKLIKTHEFHKYFERNKKATNYIQTFKISAPFAFQIQKLGAQSLNTSAALNHLFEDKISQFEQLSGLAINFPETIIAKLAELDYNNLQNKLGLKFVVQFDRGHTGSSTVFISEQSQFEQLRNAFPERHVRASQYVDGKAYTLNACIGKDGIYMGGLSAQITGIDALTPNKGGTIGNDWSYHNDLCLGYQGIIDDVTKIGKYMQSKGYKGMFGVDLIVEKTGKHSIIEINARQPASIPMYTKIQILANQIPLALLHLAEFLDIKYELDVASYNTTNMQAQKFAQIFIRPLEDMFIHNEWQMGVYKFDNTTHDLIFVRSGYDITNLDLNETLVLSQNNGRTIKKNAELARIQIHNSALDERGELYEWILNALLNIKKFQE